MSTNPENATAPTITPEGLDDEQVGDLIGCSARHVWNMVKRNEFPAPIALGRLRRWSRAVVLEWLMSQHGRNVVPGRSVQVR